MKKRLLSAALALAMVLTLLPMSAFAATTYKAPVDATTGTSEAEVAKNPVGKSFTYQASTDYSNGIKKEAGHWYWNAPANTAGEIQVYEAQSGFIIGVGTSGAWYPDGATYESKVTGTTAPSSFTLLGAAPNFNRPWPTSLNVDVNGQTLTLPTDLNACGANRDQAMTSITVTDKLNPTGQKGKVVGLTTDRDDYGAKLTSGLTVNATNVNVGAISLTGRTNTVTLTNCTFASITMSGESQDAKGTTTYAAQRLTTKGATGTDDITITGDGSTVSLQDTTSGAVSLESNGGSLTIGGLSDIGDVTVQNNTNSTANGAVPSVTVNGGEVDSIDNSSSDTTASSTITINRTTNDINVGPVTTNKGTVSVTNATVGNITVNAGSLTIAGNNDDIGMLTLGATDTTTLSITATNSTFDGVTTTKGSNLKISSWPATRDNYYGTLTLTGYTGKGVKGGTFSSATADELGKVANIDWVDNANIQFIVPVKDKADRKALYNRNELTQAISDIAATTPAKDDEPIVILGQGEPGTSTLQLNFGGNPWAYIKYSTTTGIALPTRVNNTGVAKWIVGNGTPGGAAEGTSFPSGTEVAIPAVTGTLVLDSTDTSAEVMKITNATTSGSTAVGNGNVKVTLSGNTINLSGAIVAGAGGYASIQVDLTTDVIKPDGSVLVLEDVVIDWNANTKAVSFNAIQPSLDAYGAIIQDGALVLNRGTGARYTVTANLAVSASALGLHAPEAGSALVVTVGGKLSSWSADAKKNLIDKMQEDGLFIFNGAGAQNRAMLEAINAAQATITSNDSVANWITNAQNTIWQKGYTKPDGTEYLSKHTGNLKDFLNVNSASGDIKKIKDKFNKAYIVPYLVVNVTDYNPSTGTLTATLTPYYRVDVSGDDYDADFVYTVQAGRALGALTGDMTNPVQVKLGLDALETQYMHQDGKYVYAGTDADGWKINHAGTNGLGAVEINGADGLIEIESDIKNNAAGNARVPEILCKYDTLQAAVDDTIPGKTQPNTADGTQVTETMDTITVEGSYKGSCDFTLTGYARKIMVKALGDLPIKCTSQNVDTQNPSGYTYTFQLKRDTAPTGGNITVASATGGSASVSANPATAGQKVTVTLSAQAGYSPSGVSVKDSSGKAVSVSGSGSSYSFTMPSGSVTVTPSFTKTQTTTNPTVNVSSTTGGSAYTSAGNNQVAPGTTVTVTTTPGTNQRTMGVSVTGATAVRTGANTFQFTVPSGYNTVTVTPRFDANNGTLFQDVWSYEYYSNPVRWAVERGITNGTSTYTFGSENVCTREDMVTFLWRAAGSPAVSSSVRNPFWDVQAGSYYYNAVLWAVSKGITNGVSANQFGVGQYVTRGQAVTFLYRYEGSPAAGTNSGFYDVNSREYYAKAVSWANSKGVTNGTSATTFGPNEYCKRAQIVTFLYRDITGNRA
ncbi:MAG: S-layer homology domain-containing protein [Oscillospiraceae bacterium]|nr:S-layer homology domain-containing protein [Oscillospiraceae bacterium]